MCFVFQNNTSVNKYGDIEMESAGHEMPDKLLNQTEILFLIRSSWFNSVSCLSLSPLDKSKGDDHWDRLLDKPGKSET